MSGLHSLKQQNWRPSTNFEAHRIVGYARTDLDEFAQLGSRIRELEEKSQGIIQLVRKDPIII